MRALPTTVPVGAGGGAASRGSSLAGAQTREVFKSIIYGLNYGAGADTVLEAILKKYKNVRQINWVQEEPRNMGAWHFIEPYLEWVLNQIHAPNRRPRYAGRAASMTPQELARKYMVDRVEVVEEGKYCVGVKCVSANELYFHGHFPEKPRYLSNPTDRSDCPFSSILRNHNRLPDTWLRQQRTRLGGA